MSAQLEALKNQMFIIRLVLIHVLTCTTLFMTLSGCDKNPPVVDMEDIIQSDSSHPALPDKRPVLRVAIGGMISPKVTLNYYGELLQILAGKLDRRIIISQTTDICRD